MKCDLCAAVDSEIHYHAFLPDEKREGKFVHLWICGSCKSRLKVSEDHEDE